MILKIRKLKFKKIQRYFASSFGKFLKDSGYEGDVKKLKDKNVDELDEQIQRMQVAISMKNSGKSMDSAILGSIFAVERMLSTLFNIDGTYSALANSNDFKELLEELRLDMDMGYISPKGRFIITVVQTALACNTMNSVKKELEKLQTTQTQIAVPENEKRIENGLPQTDIGQKQTDSIVLPPTDIKQNI